MAKITFVYPDFENLGVGYLMAVCLENGHEVDFVYYNVVDPFVSIKKKRVSFLSVGQKIADTKPDIAAFSCVTNNYQVQLSCARALKEIAPKVITVFGGIHPTAIPEIVLGENAVDCVAIGEAEKSFLTFVQECKIDAMQCRLPGRPIKGMVYKKEHKLIGEFQEGELADLNSLPFPYKKPLYSRFKSFSKEYFLITSRGCPNACSYCFNSHMHCLRGHSVIRKRTIDNVIKELLCAKHNYFSKYIGFVDDCFTTDSDWLLEFCERYKKEIDLPFACNAIPQYLNREKIKALRSAGCWHISIGVQSLDKELCSSMLNRNSDKRKIAEVITMLKDADIVVQVDHMLKIPCDTLQIEEEAALFYNQYRPNVISVFWLTYYPGTAIVNIAKENKILKECDIENINSGKFLENIHTGGDRKKSDIYKGICVLLLYIPLLPKEVVIFLIKHKLYNKFSTSNIFIAFGLPRLLLSILNRKNFQDRMYLVRYANKIFKHDAWVFNERLNRICNA